VEKRVIVISGPTCSGKTSLSILLAKHFCTEIISADSRQIYKRLSIGTAKPSGKELETVKHHFIDLLEPNEDYNVSRFESEALEVIKVLHRENKIPVVVGGSGLYIKAIVEGLWNDVDTDPELRAILLKEKKEKGSLYIYDKLKKIDPKSAATMLPQNWKRVIRALEVFNSTGKSIIDFHQEYKRKTDIEFFQFGLNWKREELYINIEKRVDKMIATGLVAEVKSILESGYPPELNSLNTVGYKEIIAYLNGQYSLERAIELIKRNTRRFAKRQITWFGKDTKIKWFDVTGKDDLLKIADLIITKFN